MIKERYIKEWSADHPWKHSEQVEQDLMLSRALAAIYSDPFLVERLAFRGGTALHKLFFNPQVRSCEIVTFSLEELLGTKLRALYQRKKGRDLFDLFYALTHADVDVEKMMRCYRRYIEFAAGEIPSARVF